MDSLSIQYNLLHAALLRFFGDNVKLIYVDATTLPGREEIKALYTNETLDLPVVSYGNEVLFSGRVPVVQLIKYVRRIIDSPSAGYCGQ